MTSAAGGCPAAEPAGARRLGPTLLLVALGVATAVLPVLAADRPVAALAPVLLATILYAMWKAPLRWSAAVLLFLLLALDNTYDAQSLWHSPVAILGDLLRNNLDWVYPGMPSVGGLAKLAGMEILALLLIGIGIWRRASGSTIDTRGQVQTASPLGIFVALYAISVAYAVANGLASGGSVDVAIVQARPLLHIPLFYLLFHLAFRGPRDHALLGWIVVFSACAKAGMAYWVRLTIESHLPEKMGTTTNHGDSVLFAAACLVLITWFAERWDRQSLLALVLFLPPILLGMQANRRRLAWVDLGMALAAIFVVTPWRRWKQFVTRSAILAAPVVLLYVAAGWSSAGGVFAPVRVLRTVSDAKVDRSTLYRDVENWNLIMSIDEDPVLGRGFGHGYTEHMSYGPTLDISRAFALYRAEPHNAVLGLLLFAGLLAFTGMWLLLGVGVFLAVRALWRAEAAVDRAAALCALGSVVVICVQFYGDLGQYFTQFRVVAALALVVAGKLAVATGAWPARVRRRPTASVPARPAAEVVALPGAMR